MAARFYINLPLAINQQIQLPDDIARHAGRALRLRDGDEIVLFNGMGGQYNASIHFNNQQTWAQINEFNAQEREPCAKITLYQGIPSGDKMSWIIEKAVELGASHIQPISAERSVVQLSGTRLEKRVQHWQSIAIAAAEQCGRNTITTISPPLSVKELMTKLEHQSEIIAVCQPNAPVNLLQLLQSKPTSLGFLIGPEGGWSDNERKLFKQANLNEFNFGARILRSETAGLALLASSLTLLELT